MWGNQFNSMLDMTLLIQKSASEPNAKSKEKPRTQGNRVIFV